MLKLEWGGLLDNIHPNTPILRGKFLMADPLSGIGAQASVLRRAALWVVQVAPVLWQVFAIAQERERTVQTSPGLEVAEGRFIG